MISVFRCGVPTSTAGCRSAMLIGRRIAPRSVAHAVAGVFVIRIAAVPAIGFAPVLTAGIFLPASIGIAVAGCVDGLALALTAITAILPITVACAGCITFVIQYPRMASAIRASPRTIRAGTMIFIHISAEIFCVMTFIALVVLGMAARGVRRGNVGALQRILLAAWAGADNAGGRTGGNLRRRFLDAACGGGICVLIIDDEALSLLIWIYCEDASYQDAADRLGISLQACKKRIQRAKLALKRAIEKNNLL